MPDSGVFVEPIRAADIRWPFLIGLLADTHIPYRASHLPPMVLDVMQGVDLILHAGDVDEPYALDLLREIAPVYAVRGNYHWVEGSNAGAALPKAIELDIAGVRIALTHGHLIGPLTLLWRVYVLLCNFVGRWHVPAYDRAIASALLRRFPDADVIVFGHTHRAHQAWRGKTLLVNPGAALATSYFDPPYHPSVAYLRLHPAHPPEVIFKRFGSPE